jgi:hypothetical protein
MLSKLEVRPERRESEMRDLERYELTKIVQPIPASFMIWTLPN